MNITCPNCRASHVQGTLFCEQCGTSLIGVVSNQDSPPAGGPPFGGADAAGPPPGSSATAQAVAVRDTLTPAGGMVQPPKPLRPPDDFDENPSTMPLAGMNSEERGTSHLAVGAVATRLRVLVLNTGRLTDWIDDPVIHVGRTDRSANVFPTLDLDPDGGQNAGVSRRHVRVSRQTDGYYLEDLGSINGSFLNRRRLSPGNPTELKDGDEVRLGNIVLRIVLGGFQRSQ